MGANSSRGGQSGASGTATPSANASRDLYTILGIEPSATPEEIKKAFRRRALIEHPDKNPQDPEAASKRFLEVQQAYEVLSDEQERAWYDSHKDDLANGSTGDDPDIDLRAAAAASNTRAPNISSRQLLNFFDTRGWKGFTDTDEGFFSVYRTVFALIAKDERMAKPYPGDTFTHAAPDFPSFGHSNTPYDSQVKQFYAVFQLNFVTRKAFASADVYRTTEAPDRRYKRAMEKENKRAREDARKEYNETVRSLAAFLKKRDPRFLSSNTADPLKARALDAEKLRYELRQAALDAARQREAAARQYREQDWQKVKPLDVEDSDGGEAIERSSRYGLSEGESSVSEEEEEEEVHDFWCPACEKQFQSQGAYANHENSKKHIKLLAQLKRQMLDEDAELGLDIQTAATTPEESATLPPQSLKDDTPRRKTSPHKQDDQQDDESEWAQEDPILVSGQTSQASRSQKKKGRRRQQSLGSEAAPIENASIIAETEGIPPAPGEVDVPLQISKKDKRRAKERAKKAAEADPNASSAIGNNNETCNICKKSFPSRTKLFQHVKASGHASIK